MFELALVFRLVELATLGERSSCSFIIFKVSTGSDVDLLSEEKEEEGGDEEEEKGEKREKEEEEEEDCIFKLNASEIAHCSARSWLVEKRW